MQALLEKVNHANPRPHSSSRGMFHIKSCTLDLYTYIKQLHVETTVYTVGLHVHVYTIFGC